MTKAEKRIEKKVKEVLSENLVSLNERVNNIMKNINVLKKRTYEIYNLPNNIIAAMLFEQGIQTGSIDITIFENSIDADKPKGGFDWRETLSGEDFWCKVIYDKNYYEFNKSYKDPRKVFDGKVSKETISNVIKRSVSNFGYTLSDDLVAEIVNKIKEKEDPKKRVLNAAGLQKININMLCNLIYETARINQNLMVINGNLGSSGAENFNIEVKIKPVVNNLFVIEHYNIGVVITEKLGNGYYRNNSEHNFRFFDVDNPLENQEDDFYKFVSDFILRDVDGNRLKNLLTYRKKEDDKF